MTCNEFLFDRSICAWFYRGDIKIKWFDISILGNCGRLQYESKIGTKNCIRDIEYCDFFSLPPFVAHSCERNSSTQSVEDSLQLSLW